ncbi:helix-turn-helix domain-containing protein [Burkholderia anthina]|uniref:helix-turn-helix domain-containing protein n=1 Tax=Burkholderia anthina TaxID=179879 RepID=UPI00158B3E34|nr:helix-turn-helix domain-containing protein [Burkholderia anthina]
MTSKKDKGRNPCQGATQMTSKVDSKTASTKPQDMSLDALRKMVLDALRMGPRHTYWFRARGCSHPAARVMELIAMGYKIVSYRVTAVDSDGYSHHGVAMYELIDDPEMDLVDMMMQSGTTGIGSGATQMAHAS